MNGMWARFDEKRLKYCSSGFHLSRKIVSLIDSNLKHHNDCGTIRPSGARRSSRQGEDDLFGLSETFLNCTAEWAERRETFLCVSIGSKCTTIWLLTVICPVAGPYFIKSYFHFCSRHAKGRREEKAKVEKELEVDKTGKISRRGGTIASCFLISLFRG